MSRKAIFVFCSILILIVSAVLLTSRIQVDMAAALHDPVGMKLHYLPIAHKSNTFSPNHMEIGLIHLDDGERVKFWFVNAHRTIGTPITRFDFPDGSTEYLRNGYCCEVYVTPESVVNQATLLKYIKENDGTPP